MINLDKFEKIGLRTGLLQPKRCIVVDPGRTSVKVLLAETKGRGISVLHALMIDLEREGLITAEEIHRYLGRVIDELAEAPVTLVMSQSNTISQLMEMGSKWPHNVKRAIREETQSLSGLSEKSILYDFVPLRPFHRFKMPYWVTIARENDVEHSLEWLGESTREVEGVVAPANSLINAFLSLHPEEKTGLLVDLGETATVAALVDEGQGVFATNIAIGGEQFTEAIAADVGCDYERAETLKREKDLFQENGDSTEFLYLLRRWRREIDEVLAEWAAEQGMARDHYRDIPCWLSGGSSRQPGLREHLDRNWTHGIRSWPAFFSKVGEVDFTDFVIAYGAALSGAGRSAFRVNLLPQELRRERLMRRQVQAFYSVATIVLLAVLVLMGNGVFGLNALIGEKRAALNEYREAIAITERIDEVKSGRLQAYRQGLPFLHRKKQAGDFLEMLTSLRGMREEGDFWFVLFADRESYRGGVEEQPVNRFALPVSGQEERVILVEDLGEQPWEFVVELSIPDHEPGEGEVNGLAPLVERLREVPFLLRVDQLPPGQRRDLVDEGVAGPGTVYSLILEPEPFSPGLPERSAAEREGGRPRLFETR